MKVVYIAGPYRAKTIFGRIINIIRARREALKWWKRGYAVICSHSNSALFDGKAPDSVWLAGGLELLRRSDIIVMLPGWKFSQGSIQEYHTAKLLGIKVEEGEIYGKEKILPLHT
ncbi:MAG: DUF4406 domain-containing protein [Syntrophales bacterium]|nr:DUF4406 domain-containing protein [Syntrophales bacterium]